MEIVLASLVAGTVSVLLAVVSSSRALARLVETQARHDEYWTEFHEKGWHQLGDGAGNAVELMMSLESAAHRLARIEQKLDHHVEWEETAKYSADD